MQWGVLLATVCSFTGASQPRCKTGVPTSQAVQVQSTNNGCALDLAIIFPYYEAQRELKYQLHGLQQMLNQILAQLEVIVVDDGSPIFPILNGTSGEIKRLLETLEPRLGGLLVLRILQDIPWNRAGSLNLGATYSSATWLLMLDIDTCIELPALTRLLRIIQMRDRHQAAQFMRNHGDGTQSISPSALLVSRATFWNVSGYNEDFSGGHGYEDAYMAFELIRRRYLSQGDTILSPNISLTLIPKLHTRAKAALPRDDRNKGLFLNLTQVGTRMHKQKMHKQKMQGHSALLSVMHLLRLCILRFDWQVQIESWHCFLRERVP